MLSLIGCRAGVVATTLVALMLLVELSLALPERALSQAAPGIPLKQSATITGRVTDGSGKPIAGARVHMQGPSSGDTTTDFQGIFTFNGMSFGEYAITVFARGYGTANRNHIVVTGDSSVTVRFVASSEYGLKTIAQVSTSGHASINTTPASITAINPSAYAFEGQTSWHQVLEQIPGVAVGGALFSGDNPSLYVPESPFYPAQISINGAQPYETATLLDGMPLTLQSGFAATGTGNDIGALPINSFDAADVVRGPGANSPSIVNSIGGSFIFHAPGAVYKNGTEFSYSTDGYGGFNSNIRFQVRTGRLSATLVYGVNDSPGPVNGGQIGARSGTLPSTINGNPFWCPKGFFYSCINYLGNKYTFFGSPPEFDHFQAPLLICCQQVSSAWSAHSGSVALAYQIAPQVTAQVFYAGSSAQAYQFAPFWQTTFAPGSLGTSGGGSYTGSIPPGTYNYMSTDYNNFGNRAASILEEKVTANLGKSVLRVAAIQGYSFYEQDLPPPIQNGYYQLWGTVCYGTPPVSGSGGKCTPMTFNGTRAYLTSTYASYFTESWTNNRDLLFSYETEFAPNANFGLSYVTSYYNDPYWVRYSTFYRLSQPPSIANTTDETRAHVGIQPSDRLSLDLSWYFTGSAYHIPNPADSFNATHTDAPRSWADAQMNYNAPRFGAVYRAGNDVAIRAAAGGGFALPAITYLEGSNGVISCSGGQCSQTLTNLNLQPEKSFGFDIGTDIRFKNNTVMAFDLYKTNLFGQIFQSARGAGVYRGQPLTIVEYQNLNESTMQGLNLEIRHDVPRGLYWNGGLGLTRGYIVSVPPSFYLLPGCKTPCTNTDLVPGINFTGAYPPIGRVPYANGNATIGYRWKPKTFVELSSTYLGNNNSYFVPPFVAFDLRGGYSLAKNIAIYATFENMTCQACGLYAINSPSTVMGIPAIAGATPWEGLPSIYSPRSLLLTLNYQY